MFMGPLLIWRSFFLWCSLSLFHWNRRSRRVQMRRQLQQLPSRDPDDPDYRRLHYIRYADDWLLGYTGTRREAEDIKGKIGRFLGYRLKLELSEHKTLI